MRSRPEPPRPVRRPPWRIPAWRALLVQLGAFVLVLAASFIAARLAGFNLTVAHAVLLQAVLAAGLSRLTGMAKWWAWIQFLFPLAAATVHALRLPPWIFLAAFSALVALYWSSFRTQVPYYPSRRAAWDAVAGLLPEADGSRGHALSFIDIGSGFGGLVLHLARRRADVQCAGIELAPLPWLWSLLRSRLNGSPARFLRGDYETLDLGRYDVVFAYLSPAAMPALWQKAQREMRPGTLLISHEFTIPGNEAELVLRPGSGPSLYGWRL